MVDHKYVLILCNPDALLSLTALVAGLNRISLTIVHTSDMMVHCAGDKDLTLSDITEIKLTLFWFYSFTKKF